MRYLSLVAPSLNLWFHVLSRPSILPFLSQELEKVKKALAAVGGACGRHSSEVSWVCLIIGYERAWYSSQINANHNLNEEYDMIIDHWILGHQGVPNFQTNP